MKLLLETCASCFALNRAAHEDAAIQGTAYRLKCALARWLYQHGYVEQLELTRQDFRCYHTQEWLQGRAKVCTKCRNSGVFGSKIWVVARFRVDGCSWSWHLPPGELPGAKPLDEWRPPGRDLPTPTTTPRKLAWAVWKWLVMKGGVKIASPRVE